uniref:Uncharacterized protein n=1 Tax=Brassica oleracea TaxID=3712 RepID=A0A3P6FA62_BRAOL|nr:unnamed protein product [Brassica oleracea]
MASSDVVLAHSAFDALPLGRSAQIIVGRDLNLQSLFTVINRNLDFKPKPNHSSNTPLSIYTGESSGIRKVKTRVMLG